MLNVEMASSEDPRNASHLQFDPRRAGLGCRMSSPLNPGKIPPGHDEHWSAAMSSRYGVGCMADRLQMVRARGRVWTVARIRKSAADEADFRFWYDGLTPEQRVEVVGAALQSCLKTRGLDEMPRLRRVHRRVECSWRPVPRGRRPRGRVPRAAARHQRPQLRDDTFRSTPQEDAEVRTLRMTGRIHATRVSTLP